MLAGFIHLFNTAHDIQVTRLQAALLKKGLGLRLYESVDALSVAVAGRAAAGEPQLVLLADTQKSNDEAARSLKQLASPVPVVALLPRVDARALQQAMYSGIDICWPCEAPAHLVSAAAVRLLSRYEASPAKRAAPVAAGPAPWRLCSGGWVVEAPQGARVTLTTAERSLMLALCKAPGHSLGHAELMLAIEGGLPEAGQDACRHHRSGYARSAARRLSVLVSRLRNKLADAGMELPIRSLRRRGYEISVELAPETDARGAGTTGVAASRDAGSASPASRTRVHAVAADPVLAASAADP